MEETFLIRFMLWNGFCLVCKVRRYMHHIYISSKDETASGGAVMRYCPKEGVALHVSRLLLVNVFFGC
jgi:hypothetical protein